MDSHVFTETQGSELVIGDEHRASEEIDLPSQVVLCGTNLGIVVSKLGRFAVSFPPLPDSLTGATDWFRGHLLNVLSDPQAFQRCPPD